MIVRKTSVGAFCREAAKCRKARHRSIYGNHLDLGEGRLNRVLASVLTRRPFGSSHCSSSSVEMDGNVVQ